MSMQFCCRRFEEKIDRAGQRGFAIVVSRDGQNPLKFRLQSRGVAHGDETKVKKISTQIIVNIWTQQAIEYCPYCGRRLQELLDAAPADYEALAKKHLPLAAQPGASPKGS